MQPTKDRTPAAPQPAVADFGRWLERQIDRLDMTRAEVADGAGVGRSTITMQINGKANGERIQPDKETVDKIADAMGIPRSIARIAAGYSDGTTDIDLDFCAELLSVIRTLPEGKQTILKRELRETAHNWAAFAAA